MKNKIKVISVIISVLIIGLLIGFDQLTKYLVSHNEILVAGGKIDFIPNIICFRLAYNTGAAWSMLAGKKIFLVGMSSVASIACLAFVVLKADFKKNPIFTAALTLVTAGAIGNLIDRAFFEKGVIDFLCTEFIDFPIFNVADSCLTVGAILLMVYVIFFYKEPKKVKVEENNSKDSSESNVNLESENNNA